MNQWPPGATIEQRPPLQRSATPVVAGVCSGLARYLGIDAIFVRAVFGLLTIFGGTGILLYFGAWLLMPGSIAGQQVAGQYATEEAQERSTLALVLGGVLLGFAVLLGVFTIASFRGVTFGILVLLFAGTVLLNRRAKGLDLFDAVHRLSTATSPPPTRPTPSVTDAISPSLTGLPDLTSADASNFDPGIGPNVTTVGNQGSEAETRDVEFEAAVAEARRELDIADRGIADTDPYRIEGMAAGDLQDSVVPPTGPRPHWAVPKTAEETSLSTTGPQPPGPPLASLTIAAIMAVLGVALVLNTLADIFVGAVTVSGIGLAIAGVAIASTSYRGQTLRLLPIAGIMASVLAAAPIIDHAIVDGTGSREIAVRSAGDLRSSYALGVGSITLDLTRLELTEDTTINVALGTGAIEIWLPRDLVAEVHADATLGYAGVLGQERAGINPRLHVLPASSADPDAPRLLITTSIEVGSIDVYRS